MLDTATAKPAKPRIVARTVRSAAVRKPHFNSEVRAVWQEWRKRWDALDRPPSGTPEDEIDRQYNEMHRFHEHLLSLPLTHPGDWAYLVDASCVESAALYGGATIYKRVERIIGIKPVGALEDDEQAEGLCADAAFGSTA